MTEKNPYETINLDSVGYGTPVFPWSRASEELAADTGTVIGRPYFLSTVSPKGAPHAAGIGALWDDGDMYFVSGPGTRKSRHLAANPACAITARLDSLDLTMEGAAARVTDPAILEHLAVLYRAGGWPAEVEDDAFTAPYSAPSAGPAPWYLYHFIIHSAVGVGIRAPEGATLWRFAH